jgi:LacI family transcriptional regulator
MFGANFQQPEKSQELIERRMVDGLIFLVLADDLERFGRLLVPRLNRLGIPFVVVHSISRELPYNNVGLDSAFAGYAAAERFIRLGYQDIHFFLRDPAHPQLAEALAGFKQALKDNGREWRDSLVLAPAESGADIYDGAYLTIKKTAVLPRAVFFPDEPAAYAALKACAERGLRVPEDLAVIGLDDEDTRYLETRLSTVHHPFEEKGREAVKMLTEILDGQRDRAVIHRTILKPHLVVRETCGTKETTNPSPALRAG